MLPCTILSASRPHIPQNVTLQNGGTRRKINTVHIYTLGRQLVCKMFFKSSTGRWAVLQLPCCQAKKGNLQKHVTKHFLQSGASYLSQDVVMFFHLSFKGLPGPAWAVGSYSISQSAGGNSKNIFFKTLRQIGRPALYKWPLQTVSQFEELNCSFRFQYMKSLDSAPLCDPYVHVSETGLS